LKTISEEDIERFVRFPDTLTEDERNRIQSAIADNKELRQLADWFAGFYEELDALAPTASRNTLIPLRPIGKGQAGSGAKSPLVLAAMSSSPKVGRVETVATLASEEDQTVARVLRNRKEREYKIHLIRSEQPADDEQTIFTIEDLNMDMVLDRSRHLAVKGNPRLDELDWEQSAFNLRMALGKYEFGEPEIKEEGFSENLDLAHHHISIQISNGQIDVDIQPKETMAPVISRVLITGRESGSRLIRLHGETSLSVKKQHEEALTIQFFR